MNSSTSEALWPSPVAAHFTSESITLSDSQAVLVSAVSVSINAAISSGDFTSSTDVSAAVSKDVQYVAALLNQGGYAVSNDGTNLVVSW